MVPSCPIAMLFFFEVEAYLDGSFTKHSSNSGFVADDVVRTPRKKWDVRIFSEDMNKKIFQHGDVSFPSDMFQRLFSSSVSYLGICTVDVGGHLQESLTKGYLVFGWVKPPPKKVQRTQGDDISGVIITSSPGHSKWPVHHPVGGHLTFERDTEPSQKGHQQNCQGVFFWFSEFFQIQHDTVRWTPLHLPFT